jgi:hypothetical protein
MFRHVGPCYFRLGHVRPRNFKLVQVRQVRTCYAMLGQVRSD